MSINEILNEMEIICANATPEPWYENYLHTNIIGDIGGAKISAHDEQRSFVDDRHFIVKSRTITPRLIKALREALKEINQLHWKTRCDRIDEIERILTGK